jgi:hypothetical protein
MIYEEWDKLKLYTGNKGLSHMFATQLPLTWVQLKPELSQGYLISRSPADSSLPELQVCKWPSDFLDRYVHVEHTGKAHQVENILYLEAVLSR